MNVLALVSFYDEDPAFLGQLTASLGRSGQVSHVIGLDGAYGAYPGALPTTGPEQARAILDAAFVHGMAATTHTPRDPWPGNEIEKRTFLFDLAHTFAREDDWLWVLDADELVTDAPCLRERLSHTTHEVAECWLHEGPVTRSWNSQPLRMLFKAQPTGIHVDGYHACYRTGDGRTLWHHAHPGLQVPALELHDVLVQHRPGDRGTERNLARLTYYDRVKQDRLEEAF